MEQEPGVSSAQGRGSTLRWWKLAVFFLGAAVLALAAYSSVLNRQIQNLQQQHSLLQEAEGRSALAVPHSEFDRLFSASPFDEHVDPFGGMRALREEMDRAFAAFPDWRNMPTALGMQWQDLGTEYLLEVPLDTQAQSSASIAVEGGSLVLEIETEDSRGRGQRGTSQFSQSLRRVLPLPADADPASLRHSVEEESLRIRVAKRS